MHALSPLTSEEIDVAVSTFTRTFRELHGEDELVFFDVALLEHASSRDKEAALQRDDWSGLLPRRAAIVAGNPSARLVLVGQAPTTILIGAPATMRVEPLVQPPWAAEEYALAEKLVLEHPPFRAACVARGVDPDHVRVDPWCVGWHDRNDDPTRRLGTPMLYIQERPGDALYARPLEGIRMRFDLWSTPPAVIAFSDVGPTRAPPLPPLAPGSIFPDPAGEAARPPLRPLRASQPEGVSFELGPGGELTWQRWKAVIGFSSREGAVLSAVRCDGRSLP